MAGFASGKIAFVIDIGIRIMEVSDDGLPLSLGSLGLGKPQIFAYYERFTH